MSPKLIVLSLLVFALIVLGIVVYSNLRPMSKAEVVRHLEQYFQNAAEPGKAFSGVQVLIQSEKLGIDEQFGFGKSSANVSQKLDPNQPFHVASIGKLFTATLTAMLVEDGKLNYSDPIGDYLDESTLESLFVYEGRDYQKVVTVEQLLAHTSGAADYFGDPVLSGKPFPDRVVSEPDTLWTPESLLDFTRKHQTSVGRPGEQYHYSDTGYILLGLIIEKVENKPFHEVLHERIFTPLAMDNSYLMFHSEPKNQPKKVIADIWFQNVEISRFNSLSADWAGGGIVSTPRDLLTFQKALHAGQLINSESQDKLFQVRHPFRTGIYYGMGTMEIHFEEFFFLLKGMPRVKGHIGILSTHLFYEPETKTHIIMNFGSDRKMEDSFKALIEILNTLRRVRDSSR